MAKNLINTTNIKIYNCYFLKIKCSDIKTQPLMHRSSLCKYMKTIQEILLESIYFAMNSNVLSDTEKIFLV